MKPTIATRINAFWERYWLARPGIISVAMIRIALGLSMLITIKEGCPEDYANFIAAQNPALYHPWSLLALLGNQIPPAWWLELFRKIAIIGSVTLVLGFCSRLSLLVSGLFGLFAVVFGESFQQSWSHGHNVVFLTFIAMAFVRTGDKYSIDSLILDIKGKGVEKTVEDARAYFYGVLLAQFAVGMMFFNAGFWKLRRGGRYFGWVVSDNMRNLLITNRMVLGEDLPPHLHYIVMHEWLYKGLALGNIISQITPFLAMFFIHRPKLRALCGLFFVLEYLGLGIIMRIWVPQWLPLVAVFIDWDAFIPWLQQKFGLAERRYVTT